MESDVGFLKDVGLKQRFFFKFYVILNGLNFYNMLILLRMKEEEEEKEYKKEEEDRKKGEREKDKKKKKVWKTDTKTEWVWFRAGCTAHGYSITPVMIRQRICNNF